VGNNCCWSPFGHQWHPHRGQDSGPLKSARIRTLKQNRRVKSFVGANPNTLKIQIRTAEGLNPALRSK
jgi:hypothetical protein